jgi:2-oxoisovalerate dehydrogenase E1 component
MATHTSPIVPIRSKEKLTLPNEELVSGYRLMLLSRRIDEKSVVIYKQNKSYFHIGCSGHEAVQVAAARQMKRGVDYSFPYYREMAFCLALGMTPRELFLNILSKPDDPNSGGRQMPMHYGHKELKIVSQSSVTGSQFLQAVGSAHAAKYRGDTSVTYVSAGEGTTAQGAYHEALNWAARHKLPVIFLIQDNKYAISVPIHEQLAGSSVAKISRGYEGLQVFQVDGLDYIESSNVLAKAFRRARDGEGPSLIDAQVVRLQSHSISDNHLKYRTEAELAEDRAKDPLIKLSSYLLENGVLDENTLLKISQEVDDEIEKALEWAEAQAPHDPESATTHVFVGDYPQSFPEKDSGGTEELFMVDALNRALDEELGRNPEMVIYGQDVAGGKGGVFSVTSNLTARYGEKRVFNSPLAEDSIVGTAVGMAVVGMKPVVEIQFGDYIWTGMMQLRNELAVMHYRSNGAWSCPAVVRVAVGGYIRGAVYHSQNIEATFAHIPGLVVILPSNARDAKGLLKSAIRSRDPVLFLEHKGLYRQVYAKALVGGPDELIPIGKAKIVRGGDAATVVTYGALVHKSLVAAKNIEERTGAKIEVIDLRTLNPLDSEAILTSVKKTGRLLVAHEDQRFVGFGAEIVSQVCEEAFPYLDAPPRRIAAKDTFIPQAPELEYEILPQTEQIVSALEELISF